MNVHYIICERDKIIPLEVQSGMVEMVKALSWRDVKVCRLDSDHAPIAGKADEVSKIIKKTPETL